MSEDWNVHCLDCNETEHFNDANHRDDLMAALCRHAKAIAALAPLFKDPGNWLGALEFRTSWGPVDVDWFVKHAGHRLVPISEYGGFMDQCPEYVDCVCGRSQRCTLQPEHAPPCSIEPRK